MKISRSAACLVALPLLAHGAPNYAASYQAQFQYLLDDGCFGPNPQIQVGCHGDIKVTKVSDNSIVCQPTTQHDGQGRSFITCTNDCNDNTCPSVWKHTTGGHSGDGPFGKIDFQCSGNDIDNIDAFTRYDNTGDGRCPTSDLRNVRVARLGVQCKKGSNEFDFDDFYFECGSYSVGFNAEDGFSDTQSCEQGSTCGNSTGCNFQFSDFEVKADHNNFDKSCVTTENGALVPKLTPMDVTGQDQAWRTRFYAAWASLSDMPQCGAGPDQKIRIECVNGIVELQNRRFSSTATCEQHGPSVLECADSGPAKDFAGVYFTCVGFNRPPKVEVTYKEDEVSCDNNPEATSVFNAVQLGPICSLARGPTIVVGDQFVECGAKSHLVDELNRQGEDGIWWTCAEDAQFPANSQSNQVQTLSDVMIGTDDHWRREAHPLCLERVFGYIRPPDSPHFPSKGAAHISGGGSEPDAGSITGAVIGALAIVGLVVVALVVWKKRHSRKNPLHAAESRDFEKQQDTTWSGDVEDNEFELSTMDGDKMIT